ncbi:MAG: hypothetical protein C5B49_08995 [Bdellovibrio sp.]|nr:MAG: hypothetical protein C5B49_08995 [Bdellovibrio sp.]
MDDRHPNLRVCQFGCYFYYLQGQQGRQRFGQFFAKGTDLVCGGAEITHLRFTAIPKGEVEIFFLAL